MEDEETMLAARAKLAARFGDQSRTGGKGSMRRKKKVQHKNPLGDDKKLQAALKRLGVQNLPSIEEVNFFQEDNNILHFNSPQVQAQVKDNLYVITGQPETKSLQDLMPGIIPQLGAQNMDFLKEMIQANPPKAEEDEIPELTEDTNFEDIADS